MDLHQTMNIKGSGMKTGWPNISQRCRSTSKGCDISRGDHEGTDFSEATRSGHGVDKEI